MQAPDYTVFVDGIYDLFHAGHENLFRQAIEKGKEFAGGREVKLLVGVCGLGVAEYKRKTIMSLDERCAAVRTNSLVHGVIENSPIRIDSEFLHKHKIDLVIHGDDFNKEKIDFYYGDAVEEGKFATVPYTKGVSTTDLIRQAKNEGSLPPQLASHVVETSELVKRIQARCDLI